MASQDPQDLQDSPDSPEVPVHQVPKETEDLREHLAASDPLVPPGLKELQDSPERRETPARLSQ